MQVVFRLYFRSGWFFLEQGKSCCGLYIISWKVGFLHPSYFWGYGDVFEKFKLWWCYLEMQVWWFLLWTYGDVILKCKLLGFFIFYYVDISWKWMLFWFCSLFYQVVFFWKCKLLVLFYYGLWWCSFKCKLLGCFNLGGYKVRWLIFCIIIQFFTKWHALTCY